MKQQLKIGTEVTVFTENPWTVHWGVIIEFKEFLKFGKSHKYAVVQTETGEKITENVIWVKLGHLPK
mgnify:CR=1 FL=1